MDKKLIVLGIESSCDDTSAAILKGSNVLSNIISSQDIDKQYGGVVPELASRAHQQNIIPVADTAIKSAKIEIKNRKKKIQKEYKPLLLDLKFSKRLLFNGEIVMKYLLIQNQFLDQ